MIGLVKKYASSQINNGPFPDRYNSQNGQTSTFVDRTVVGGHFALVCYPTIPIQSVNESPHLAFIQLLVPDVKQGSITSNSGPNGTSDGHNSGAASGGPPVLPVVLALTVLACTLY